MNKSIVTQNLIITKMKLFKFTLIIIGIAQFSLCTHPREDRVGILILSPSHTANNNPNYSNNTEIETSDGSEKSTEQRKDNNWESSREENSYRNRTNENSSNLETISDKSYLENEKSRIESLYETEFNLQSTSSEPTILQQFKKADEDFEKTCGKYKNQTYTKESNRNFLFQRLSFHGIDLNKKMEYGNYPKMIHLDFIILENLEINADPMKFGTSSLNPIKMY